MTGRGAGDVVLRSARPVTLVGGAGHRPEDLAAALALGHEIVAADSGADHVLAAGHVPRLVVGDMDSIGADARARLAGRLHEVAEQDSTDFDKLMRAVDAPLLLGVGFLAARLDHELAAMSVLARSPRRCLLIGPHDAIFAAPPRTPLELDLAAGTRVSLFPMAPVTGSSEGLRWPVDGLDFAPDGRIGTSNEATGRVRLMFRARGMLVLVPRASLAAAAAALA